MASAAAKRYARAVFELAQEAKDRDRWANRIDKVVQAFADDRIRTLLENPSVPEEARVDAVEKAAKGWDEETRNLAKLLVEHGRVDAANEIGSEYQRLVDEAEGRVRATATTAVELSTRERTRLAGELSERLGRDVRLAVEVDPSILGGMVLRFGDRIIDASVRTRLQQLRRRLVSA